MGTTPPIMVLEKKPTTASRIPNRTDEELRKVRFVREALSIHLDQGGRFSLFRCFFCLSYGIVNLHHGDLDTLVLRMES